MNREEIYQYLIEKKELVTPVAVAENAVREAKIRYDKAVDFLNKTIAVFAFLTLLMGFSGKLGNASFWGAIVGGLFFIKYKFHMQPAKEALQNAQRVLHEETNYPPYVDGMQGFPVKFYNYWDLLRLSNLIAEGRADDLKEAFNLLESQQFQETQISIQEEMVQLQADIAASARATAVATAVTASASIATAFNTGSIANSSNQIAQNTRNIADGVNQVANNTMNIGKK